MIQDISKIDPNFLTNSVLKEAFIWMDVQQAPFSIHGLAVHVGDRYQRMPEEAALAVSDKVADLNWHTAGGRVRFAADSEEIAIRVDSRFQNMMSHMPLTGSAGVDVFINGRFQGALRPASDAAGWYEGAVENPFGMAQVEINLPLYNGLCHMLIGVKPGSKVEAAKPYRIPKPIVYYGSSITQGGCASRPGNAYQGHLTRWLDVDHINLGFSGNAHGEKEMAEYIASLDMSAFVMDYDHNATELSELEERHEAFFRTIRSKHPELPVLFVTRPDPDRLEYEHWEPGFGKKARDIVYRTYEKAQASGDDKVWFLDGRDLYGDQDRDACSVDGCHPNDLGFYRMAERMYPKLKAMLEL